jgi:hypothetical protein
MSENLHTTNPMKAIYGIIENLCFERVVTKADPWQSIRPHGGMETLVHASVTRGVNRVQWCCLRIRAREEGHVGVAIRYSVCNDLYDIDI